MFDIDEEFLRLMDIVTPQNEEETRWNFTDEAIKMIHNLAKACRETEIFKASEHKAEKYKIGRNVEDLWTDMLVKIAVAPTRFHAFCTVRLMMPIVSEAINEGRWPTWAEAMAEVKGKRTVEGSSEGERD